MATKARPGDLVSLTHAFSAAAANPALWEDAMVAAAEATVPELPCCRFAAICRMSRLANRSENYSRPIFATAGTKPIHATPVSRH
jgi:hypothetical protein